MPANPKIFHHGDVVEITTRIRSGLPLTSAPFVQIMLKGALARALELAPVDLCHIVPMGNHVHMIIVVSERTNVANFMSNFKGRTSHLINKMRGTTGPVWERRYDSPVILDKDKLVERLVYHYTNPQRANLVESIDDYPQFNSWQETLNNGKRFSAPCKVLARSRVPQLPNKALSPQQVKHYTKAFEDAAWTKSTLRLEPRRCFEALGCDEQETNRLLELVVKKVRAEETALTEQRTQQRKKVVGGHKLICGNVRRAHSPEKHGTRSICLSSVKKLRVRYLRKFKAAVIYLRELYEQWRRGNFVPYPHYAFAPGHPPNVNLIIPFADIEK